MVKKNSKATTKKTRDQKQLKKAKAFGRLLPLHPGDVVDVVAPGSSPKSEDVSKALDLLRLWGLKPRLRAEFSGHPFHSHEDSVRSRLLIDAFLAKDSKAVLCLRGGYGSLRMIPALLKVKARLQKAKPKIFLGYSDITTLHLFVRRILRWPVSLHGPLLESLISGKMSDSDVEHCRQILFGEDQRQNQGQKQDSKKQELKVQTASFELKPMNGLAKKTKSISGFLIGGNLNVLQSSLGTDLSFQTKKQKGLNEIVVFEDIGERGYRVDRMLEHLKQAKAFKNCSAIVFGDFVGGKEADGGETISFALQRFANEINIACYSGLPMGHGVRNQIIPFGQNATIQLDKTTQPADAEKSAMLSFDSNF